MGKYNKSIIWTFVVATFVGFLLYTSLFISWQHPATSSIFRFKDGLPELLAFSQLDIAINYDFVYNKVLFDTWLYYEPLSVATLQQLHPRSTTIIFDHISPVGFPGIIVLFSSLIEPLVAVFGVHTFNIWMVLLIPLFALATPILLYEILTPLFRWRIALCSALLLYVMPLWWYYANWPAQHHIPLIFFVLLSIYFAMRSVRKHTLQQWRVLYSFLSGSSFAAAIYMRPTEALWLVVALVILIFQQRKRLRVMTHVMPFFIAAALMAIVYFYTQTTFYGSAFASGYVIPQESGSGGVVVGGNILNSLGNMLLPYGFNLRQLFFNTYHYLFRFVFPWAVFALVGFIVTFIYKDRPSFKRSVVYAWYVVGISAWLIIYYGSSAFSDSLSGSAATIGTSYTRYFLPIYVLCLPFVVRGIIYIRQYFPSPYRFLVTIISFVILIIHAGHSVYSGVDGISMLRKNIQQFYVEREAVLQHTPPYGIIVTEYADKYIFPYRRVIVTGKQEEHKALPALKELFDTNTPLFWYGHVPPQSMVLDEWNNRLNTQDLELKEPLWSNYTMELRRIEKKF